MSEPGFGRIFGIERILISVIFSTLIKNSGIKIIAKINQRNHNKNQWSGLPLATLRYQCIPKKIK
jgi:hypothetical protein